MRRFILPAVVASALTLALAGPASAKTTAYIGNTEVGGQVGFNLKKNKKGKKVKDFTFLQIPIKCTESTNTASGLSFGPRSRASPLASVTASCNSRAAWRCAQSVDASGCARVATRPAGIRVLRVRPYPGRHPAGTGRAGRHTR